MNTVNTEDDCTICFENLTDDSTFLICSHRFHRKCISEWLIEQSTCPICRTSLSNESTLIENPTILSNISNESILIDNLTILSGESFNDHPRHRHEKSCCTRFIDSPYFPGTMFIIAFNAVMSVLMLSLRDRHLWFSIMIMFIVDLCTFGFIFFGIERGNDTCHVLLCLRI